MTHLIAYVDACMEIADARSEVEASRMAAKSVEGSPIHATMQAVTHEGMLKRHALIGAGRNGGV
jgi:hypothetical protein